MLPSPTADPIAAHINPIWDFHSSRFNIAPVYNNACLKYNLYLHLFVMTSIALSCLVDWNRSTQSGHPVRHVMVNLLTCIGLIILVALSAVEFLIRLILALPLFDFHSPRIALSTCTEASTHLTNLFYKGYL